MMAAGLEIRSGDLSVRELAALPETMRSRRISSMVKKDKTPAVLKAEKLVETYSDVDWQDAVVAPAALAKLFKTGIVDVDVVNEHLARHPLVVGYTQIPAWRRLWRWDDLPRSQYLEAREKLINEL